ncbi:MULTISPECIES: type II toxin-antitoxin system Phd/YefM family antitoxin [Pseudomonas syringae group]|uniref:Antitoxin n=4 Tax=Pseudomonas syringae group TaxID=136849 RepID=A0AAD0GSW6_9PSED|nr:MULTISPECIES: type II toxin-antitoxin system prevent-host-death family antitoxin [Pseudomonas syringae group]AVB22656.1 type II toxin-antitoxin system Phd/YefM family antitoxin [Pseudomonas avellanae]EGH08380.1 prevent-host-death family protein [Pseudomonas amygdali pv. morsprunorum str. M302280]KWS68876.1 prevent-host-death protein [Pseudomonas amygdali pv. morsprunorum]PHN47569.1 prevent-host-death protein [Pseudomonas avellanae]POC97085.1 prevent-host-death protein [Pseudomonas avellanae
MQTHNIHAAKTHFSQLVDAAAGGETIIIAKAGIPVAKLVPISAPKRRGMLSHVTFDAEASDAMDAEITELFEGKK